MWDKKPAADAFVPVAHPAETNAAGAVPRSRKDAYAAPARVAAVSLRRPDAGTFSLGVPAPAASVALNRQTPVRATTGSNGPASPGGNAPQKALVSSPATTVAGPQPQAAAAQDLYVDSTNPNQGGVYAGATYAVPAGNTTYNNAYVGYNGAGTVTQAGGNLTLSSSLVLGSNPSSSGTYNLTGGSLSTAYALIGDEGAGTFTQSGGTFSTSNYPLVVGEGGNGGGTYSLSGTGSLSTGEAFIGLAGAGTFAQNGGTFTINGGSSSSALTPARTARTRSTQAR